MKKRVELLGKKLHLGRETLRLLDLGKGNLPEIAGGIPAASGNCATCSSYAGGCTASPQC